MSAIEHVKVSPGIEWVSIPKAGIRLLCGCPADSVKHLIRVGLVRKMDTNGVVHESGPNAILLSDVPLQAGQFANLAEFPVLQMLYRQGMLLPEHPMNTGQKPRLIGSSDQVEAQLAYIYRGNYGLSSLEELRAAGLSEQEASHHFAIKKHFAFGRIRTSEELVDTVVLGNSPKPLGKGAAITRLSPNRFLISFHGESVEVDLSLKPGEQYEAPYRLGFYDVPRDYFGIIHSGEGDGWDTRQPCMASIISFNGEIYLVDAGPSLLDSLVALGISINAVTGVFHTHAHDDHFAGLTTLVQSDHKIFYYSTPEVRHSVAAKLGAVMGLGPDCLERFFEVRDLAPSRWNSIGNLRVLPRYSPHPVETANFVFAVDSPTGPKTYAHLADISSARVLDAIAGKGEPGLAELCTQVRSEYLEAHTVKKIDAGGGLIHGEGADFSDDPSEKIVISHKPDDELSNVELSIGSRVSFGSVETLIEGNKNVVHGYARKNLTALLGKDESELSDLLNCPVLAFEPGAQLLKAGRNATSLYMILTGIVEMIRVDSTERPRLASGSLLGAMSTLNATMIEHTYRALSHVAALKIPASMYLDFIARHRLEAQMQKMVTNWHFLSGVSAFASMSYSPKMNAIAMNMQRRKLREGAILKPTKTRSIAIVVSGKVALEDPEGRERVIGSGEIFWEEVLLENGGSTPKNQAKAATKAEVGLIPIEVLDNIPSLFLTLTEIARSRAII